MGIGNQWTFAHALSIDKSLEQNRHLLLISGLEAQYDLCWRGLLFGRQALSWATKCPGKHTTLGESSGPCCGGIRDPIRLPFDERSGKEELARCHLEKLRT